MSEKEIMFFSKLVFMIPHCEPETFTPELLCSRQYIECTGTGSDFDIWENGKVKIISFFFHWGT